jgi:hypothetical protein
MYNKIIMENEHAGYKPAPGETEYKAESGETGPVRPATSANRVLQEEWEKGLQTDEYEVASDSLGRVQDFGSWRQAANKSAFPQFYKLIEGATLANKAGASPSERAEVADKLVDQARTLSPRSSDLYMSFLSDLDGTKYDPEFEMTQRQHEALKDSGDLSLLQDPNVPWDVKLNKMQTRIEHELKGRKALDRREKEKKAAEEGERERSDSDTPPPDQEESKPGMDEMERLKEGEEAPAIWTISPARGGYFKEQSFDTWDSQRNVWKKSISDKEEFRSLDATGMPDLTIVANIPANQWTRLPVPYNYHVASAAGDHFNASFARDVNGDYLIRSSKSEGEQIRILLNEKNTEGVEKNPPTKSPDMPANLTEETQKKVTQIGKERNGNLAKARALASYTMRHLDYSNDSSYNSLYEGHQAGYIGAIDQFKKADCDVANTYFAALCRKLDIPVRHVVGHMVKGKDDEGNSRITSGTGHAWSEVWDEQKREWMRVDATPPGDPQQEEEQSQDGNSVPGDYGEQEAIGPTEEELQELQKKLSKHTEELSYTQAERELSEATGVDLKDARKIVKEINEAENTRLPNGERVVDAMAQMWELIRDSRKTKTRDYDGPLRKREGGEAIDDIVAHKIGMATGDSDPVSREKEFEQEHVEQNIREMQVGIIGDKSGSMMSTVEEESKWSMQRSAIYIALSSLYRAEQNMQRSANRMSDPLSLKSEVISFRGSHDIDVDKPLSNQFSLADKVNLWQSLGNQGMGNGDIAALTYYRDQIRDERAEKESQGKKDDVLRVILACSDGMPESVEGVHQLAAELGGMNTVTVGIGMTETAAQVPHIFDTPHSKGDYAKDMSDLPAILAKHVVGEAVKLFPEKTRAQYQKSIDAIVAKFGKVGVQ